MSDVINGVPRELLKVAVDVLNQHTGGESDCANKLRALLTEQPQASVSCVAREGRPSGDNVPCTCQPQASAAQSAPAGEREAELVSALDHIAKTCNRSRTSTRRLRWIEQRAKWAIEGKPYDRDAFDLPKDGGSTAHKLSLEVARLKAELAEAQRAQSAPVVPEGWRLVPVEPTLEMVAALGFNGDIDLAIGHGAIGEEVIEKYTEMLAAAPAQPAAQELCKVCKGFGRYQDGDSGTDADGRAQNIVDCDCADSERLPQYRAAHDKFDDVLQPFLAMMRAELHANSGKGDRPGWLSMDRKTALLEIFYHLGKLQKATKDGDQAGIREYSADVANMSMMLADICGVLPEHKPAAQGFVVPSMPQMIEWALCWRESGQKEGLSGEADMIERIAYAIRAGMNNAANRAAKNGESR